MKINYEQFELSIPRCFRNERLSFLDDMDTKIDEINNRISTEENNNLLSEIKNERIETEDLNRSNNSQFISQESSESYFDVDKFVLDAQSAPTLQKVTSADNSRESSIKFIQKHIRAARDRVAVNECICVYIYVI